MVVVEIKLATKGSGRGAELARVVVVEIKLAKPTRKLARGISQKNIAAKGEPGGMEEKITW